MLYIVGAGGRQVDFVNHRHDFQIVLYRHIGVGKGLRLDALGSVDHQNGALACGKAAGYFIAEIHVSGGVD